MKKRGIKIITKRYSVEACTLRNTDDGINHGHVSKYFTYIVQGPVPRVPMSSRVPRSLVVMRQTKPFLEVVIRFDDHLGTMSIHSNGGYLGQAIIASRAESNG